MGRCKALRKSQFLHNLQNHSMDAHLMNNDGSGWQVDKIPKITAYVTEMISHRSLFCYVND